MHKRTGIPVTTLRFYEKELPDFFTVEKTSGGHRRYTDESVHQFLMIKKMVESDGIRLSQIREKFNSHKDGELRGQVDVLLAVYETLTGEIERLRVRIESLEMAMAALKKTVHEATSPDSKKRRWF
ncbi:MAG: MerR family transcriptional regulator [Thermoanaerobaculia bacterium]